MDIDRLMYRLRMAWIKLTWWRYKKKVTKVIGTDNGWDDSNDSAISPFSARRYQLMGKK